MEIITFSNEKYCFLTLNWVSYLQMHGINNYLVFSLDKKTFEYFREKKINTKLITNNNMFTIVRKQFKSFDRLKYILELLEQGKDVLHSDVDAIWLKNPLKFISNNYDIISSTGTFPPVIKAKLGYTLCMGWIYFKSCDIVKKLLKTIVNSYQLSSDQNALNLELFTSSDRSSLLNEKYSNLKLKILNQKIVSRRRQHNSNTYVAHPLTPRRLDKEQILKNKNLWNLLI